MPLDTLIEGGGIAGARILHEAVRDDVARQSLAVGRPSRCRATEPLNRGRAVAASATRETSRTFHRLGGHPGDTGEFVVKSL
jgi:hypothetical protein